MIINGIMTGKLKEMDTVLAELKSLGNLTLSQLIDDWKTKRAIERDLQVLMEIVIDICQRMLSLSDCQPAPTSAEAIEQCQTLKIIKPNPNYRLMVQFRNFVVHRYESVDNEILCDIVNHHLNDIISFKVEIQNYVNKS